MIKRASFIGIALVACAACADTSPAHQAILYRNSNLSPAMRIPFASFDATGEANSYNIDNCQMTARALNANIRAQPGHIEPQSVGFWCEPGEAIEEGRTPVLFDAEFPTEVG